MKFLKFRVQSELQARYESVRWIIFKANMRINKTYLTLLYNKRVTYKIRKKTLKYEHINFKNENC